MKHTIYTLHCDTDAGNDTIVYGSKQELRAEIEGIIATINPELAHWLAGFPSMECPEWKDQYSVWRESESGSGRYYSWNQHEINLPCLDTP